MGNPIDQILLRAGGSIQVMTGTLSPLSPADQTAPWVLRRDITISLWPAPLHAP